MDREYEDDEVSEASFDGSTTSEEELPPDFDDESEADEPQGHLQPPPLHDWNHHLSAAEQVPAYESDSDEEGTKKKKKKDGFSFDRIIIPIGGKDQVERALTWRTTPDGGTELYVKYKHMGHIHCEWLSRAATEASSMGKSRVKKYLDCNPIPPPFFSEEDVYNPKYAEVDRIIDEGEAHNVVYYLVKWRSLPYIESTWERSDLVESLSKDAIPLFHKRRTFDETKALSQASKGRPTSTFVPLPESPVYLDGNTLRSYQLEGVNWLLHCYFNGQSSILADEMGLGKTVQSIGFLNELYYTHNIRGPFIVIAPLSTLGNWEKEFAEWTDLNVVTYHGREPSRNLLVSQEFFYYDADGAVIPGVFKFDVLLTTYEMATAGASQLRLVEWRVAILDEAHRLKNRQSKTGEVLKTFPLQHRVLLTGTPLQNNLEELWSILNFLEPTKFYSQNHFMQEYGSLKTAEDVQKVQALLKPLMLRRLKEDVEASIPIKEETIIEVALTTIQKKYYRAILEKNFAFLRRGAKRANAPNLVNAMVEIRKCCMHPYLIAGAEETILAEEHVQSPQEAFQCMINASGKLVLVDKLLKKLKDDGHRVLIFSQMTRTLDILQDYLVGRGYGYERIDGSIRGEQRQAAIDRFCAPDSTSFVFLLCTRAGGQGINLTAADTVIIYDSDWNPLNDLQAQARVHRIGQTKAVQIYRLITANTYERDMFDRAGLKLGLEKAVLQKMDAETGLDDTNTGALSNKEIELLLKKGAYGALMDDEESQRFCAEDIDQILEKRATVVRHATGGDKGSVFSKATFSTNQEDIAVDDPSFWDKIAHKAKLHVDDTTEADRKLAQALMMGPRRRRGARFEGEDSGPEQPDDDFDYNATAERDFSWRWTGENVQVWSQLKRTQLERLLMIWGLSHWETILEGLSGRADRSVNDIKAVVRCAVLYCLDTPQMVSDYEMRSDMMALLELPENKPMDFDGRIIDPPLGSDLPYLGANSRQITDYRSFLLDAGEEYKQHLAKKAKNLLTRIQMLYHIRYKIRPNQFTVMPPISGVPPEAWWSFVEDRDLLIGVLKHGYQAWDAIRKDPELGFAKRRFIIRISGPDGKAIDNRDEELDYGGPRPESIMPYETEKVAQEMVKIASFGPGASLWNPNEKYYWPTPSEIGMRMRKVMSSFAKQFKDQAKSAAVIAGLPSLRPPRETNRVPRPKVPKSAVVYNFARTERTQLQRTLQTWGLPPILGVGTTSRDWTKFKDISGVQKPDAHIEAYVEDFLSRCRDVVARGIDNDDVHRAGDALSLDKAKRVLNHLEMYSNLRTLIMDPHFEAKIAHAKRHSRSGLPAWWVMGHHDKFFIQGVVKHGALRFDKIVNDTTLPFGRDIEQNRLMEASKVLNPDGTPRPVDMQQISIQSNPVKESEWMREQVSMRRVEYLYEVLMDLRSPAFNTGRRSVTRIPRPSLTGPQEVNKIQLELNRIRKEWLDAEIQIKAKFVPLNLDENNEQQLLAAAEELLKRPSRKQELLAFLDQDDSDDEKEPEKSEKTSPKDSGEVNDVVMEEQEMKPVSAVQFTSQDINGHVNGDLKRKHEEEDDSVKKPKLENL